MQIKTEIRARSSRVYRLIGVDLWSAATTGALRDHEYVREQANVIDATMTTRTFRVVFRDGFVWLDA